MATPEDRVTPPKPLRPPTEIPAFALTALAFATIFVISIPVAAWVYQSQRPGVDFVSFWAAGQLAISGHPALAYDINAHRAIEQTVTTLRGLMPFPYPPPFLLVVSLVAWLPYWLAYLPWIVVTSGLYLVATRTFVPLRFALAHPAALVNSIIGQNGFLTSGMFLAGVSIVTARPLLGGTILGLLVVKPQLAVLVPIALVAERNWRAIGAAAVSSLLLLALAAVVFGFETYKGFLAVSSQQAAYLSTYSWHWNEQVSVFAFLRSFGVGQSQALIAQGIVAVAAAVVTWRAWAAGLKQRAAVLAAATILVPPYLFIYDSLILILPLAEFLKDRQRPWRAAIIWVCLLVPLFGYVDLYKGPNPIPVAAALCLWWLCGKSSREAAIAATPAAGI